MAKILTCTLGAALTFFLALAAENVALAVETKTWTQSEASEFEKGTLKGLSISNDGRVSLAHTFREIYDPSLAYLWSAATNSKGVLYAGGAGGKILMVEANGKGKVLGEIAGSDVYAVAVNKKDEVFAAVSPEAKVYRVDNNGKTTLFYDAKEKYSWALAVHPQGDLFLATGDQGRIHRISPDGKGSVFYDTGETHVRSLAFDSAGNLIAGTEPGGLILRVTPQGAGFVLYQTARREVTAVAVARDGAIYASGVGAKTASSVPAGPPVTVPAPQPSASATGGAQTTVAVRPVAAPPPTLAATGPTVSGGSEIYRLEKDGEPRRIWGHAQHVVYALALDPQDRLIAGTGNQGLLYRIDSDRGSTRLLDAQVTQFTALVYAPGGKLYALTSNAGKVYQVGPDLEVQGVLESEVFDAGTFSYWGRLRYEAEANGGSVQMETRSGNLERQYSHWSEWAISTGRITSPPARFLEWRATLKAASGGQSPVLSVVEAAYLAKNLPPSLERIEKTPSNYRFPSASLSTSSGSTLTLPPIGQARRSSSATSSDASGSQTMNYEKGYVGARWKASDPNADTLTAKIEIKGVEEKEWKLLRDKLRDSRYAWDSSGFADGRYILRVTVDDAYDNYPDQELKAEIVSDPFVIDNTPPRIINLQARFEGNQIKITWKAQDALSALALAEFAVNGGDWISAEPTTRITDSPEHDYVISIGRPAGNEFTIAVRVTDENDNVAVEKVVIR